MALTRNSLSHLSWLMVPSNEVDYFLHFLQRIELIDPVRSAKSTDECRQASRLTFGLLRAARSDAKGTDTKHRYLREEPLSYVFDSE